MTRLIFLAAVLSLLAACAADKGRESSLDEVTAAAFRSAEPPSLTLITMVNNKTGSGGHTALMINGSQRVIFDPAGSFRDERVVERGDVLYGITPGWFRAYQSAHSRASHHVVTQKLTVTPAQAEKALRLAQASGPVAGAFCAQATTGILEQIDGFEGIRRTFYPVNLMEQFAAYPGVETDKYFENDAGDLVDGVAAALELVE
ncbi:MAG: hypothetical protein AAF307_07630 [Pseudomonadota bacterium]